MTNSRSILKIETLPTGVPNLDTVLGGGIPVLSTNIIAGAPGAGKTTLAQQIAFHNASPTSKVIYFSAMGEPITKLLRYQQQFDFFDPSKMDDSLYFIELGDVLRGKGVTQAFEVIRENVEKIQPALVILDSFRTITDFASTDGPQARRSFVYDLVVSLSTWGVTSFLCGEYQPEELDNGPEFTVADGIIWLTQEARRNSIVRKLEVRKCRGMSTEPGKHPFRISSNGIEVFPRLAAIDVNKRISRPGERMKFGIPGLDEMLHGGMPAGESMLIAGSSGTGKTLTALHFIAEGVKNREPSVLVSFEERPEDHVRKAKAFGWDLPKWEEENLLRTIYLRPVDLSVDEVLNEIIKVSADIKARRVVINSISGFELAVAETDKEEFREGLYRLTAALTGYEVTVLMTTELPDMFGGMTISPGGLSFLSDNVLLLRFVEIESQLHKAIIVIKMRTSSHDTGLREYSITNKGVVVSEPFSQYHGVLSGIPTLRTILEPQAVTAGLTHDEEDLMHVLLALHEASAADLAENMELPTLEVETILDKLARTGYVSKIARGGTAVYRVAMVTPSLSTQTRQGSKGTRDRRK